MAPAGLLNRELAASAAHGARKSAHFKLGARNGVFLVKIHQIGWKKSLDSKLYVFNHTRMYIYDTLLGFGACQNHRMLSAVGFHDLCISQMASKENQHTWVVKPMQAPTQKI